MNEIHTLVNVVITGLNIGILAINIKLYSEFVKMVEFTKKGTKG